MNKVHVKTGDTVVVLSGKDKGKQGTVLAVSPSERKVIVEKINMVSKHVKPRRMGEPAVSSRLRPRCTLIRFRLFVLAARSRQESATRFSKTAPRAVSAENAAK